MGGLISGTKGTGGEAAGAQGAANLQGIEELRRQFDIASQNVTPFIEAGIGALGDLTSGATIQGFGDRLKQLFSGGALEPLLDERTRAVEGQLSAGGLTRSGAGLREIADIPTQLGLMIENLLFGRSQNLAGQGLSGGLNLGNLGQQAAGGVANLFSRTGQARSSGIVTDAQARAADFQQGFDIIGDALPIIASFFSDPNLKENVEEVAEFRLPDESKNLKVYQWDWIPEVEETIVRFYPTIGFMADEVEEKYPQHIHKYGGFKTINIQSLLNELEELNELQEAA